MASKAMIFNALLDSQRASGVTLSGGKVYFYTPGTTNYKTIYSDRDKQVTAANPVTLDSNGQARVYGDGLYDIQVKNAALSVSLPLWEDVKISDSELDADTVSNYASLAAAVTAIGSTRTTLNIGTDQTVSDNLTIPSTLSIQMLNGAIITIASTKTLTMNGTFSAVRGQCFSGAGTVLFGRGVVDCVYPEWWGAKADAVWTASPSGDLYGMNVTTGVTATGTDSTDAIEAATACAMACGSIVSFTSGAYLATTLTFDSGVNWIGTGTKKTAAASAAAPTGTVIKQINGTNSDFITVANTGGVQWIESASIRGMRFIGDPTGAATRGSGFNCDKTAGENFTLDDVRFDYFPWFGIKFNRGVQPCVLNNIHLFWNGYSGTDITDPILGDVGSGLCITKTDVDVMQAGQFSNISGDSNKFALIYVKSGPPASTGGGNLLFTNIKAETGVRDTQPDVFVLNNCGGTNITINSCSNMNTGQAGILSITKANPGVITTGEIIDAVPTPIPHGLLVDDYVTIHSPGMVELSGNTYKVNTVPTTSTLTLKTVAGVPVDTSAFTDYTSGGFVQLNTNSIVRIVDAVDPVSTAEPAINWIGLAAENSTRNIIVDEVNSVTLPNTGGSRYQNGYYGLSGFYTQYGVTFGNIGTSTDTACLNYYKEQTFTPTLSFASGSGHTYNSTLTKGRLTRIGNTCTFRATIVLTGLGTSAGAVTMGTLPYSNVAEESNCALYLTGGASGTGDRHLQATIPASGTTIVPSTITSGNAVQLLHSDLTAATTLEISGVYFTEAS